jgi:hypothetical protein
MRYQNLCPLVLLSVSFACGQSSTPIVADLGADRGILLSEAGFQSGAVEAANLTNVHVNSLATLQTQAETEVIAMRLRELFDRAENCRQRNWDIPKSVPIEFGLRSDSAAFGYGPRADKQRIEEWFRTHNTNVFNDSELAPPTMPPPQSFQPVIRLRSEPRHHSRHADLH